jgi:hypothetical protein
VLLEILLYSCVALPSARPLATHFWTVLERVLVLGSPRAAAPLRREGVPLSLRDRIFDETTPLADLAAYLDDLSPEQRLAETRSLSRNDQRTLYRRAASAAPVSLDDFVPAGVSPLAQVIHDGRNTLPLPGGLRLFQKRFCRPEGGGERLFGYNQSPFLRTIGPGFFVAVPTKGRPAWEERGAVVIDYFQVPDGAVCPSWPKVVPNTRGLQYFVYHRTRDFMRRVSTHVTIGAAFRGEHALDHYFVLCREPG